MDMDDLFLAPLVIFRRLPQLWFEALHPNPLISGETQRAITEKVAAIGEGLLAAHTEALAVTLDMGAALIAGKLPATDSMDRITEAALAPARKRVRANMRRLSRR